MSSSLRCASTRWPKGFSTASTTRVPCSSNKILIADSLTRSVRPARDSGASTIRSERQNRKRSHLRLMLPPCRLRCPRFDFAYSSGIEHTSPQAKNVRQQTDDLNSNCEPGEMLDVRPLVICSTSKFRRIQIAAWEECFEICRVRLERNRVWLSVAQK